MLTEKLQCTMKMLIMHQLHVCSGMRRRWQSNTEAMLHSCQLMTSTEFQLVNQGTLWQVWNVERRCLLELVEHLKFMIMTLLAAH